MTYFAPTELQDALDLIGRSELDVVAGCSDYFPARQDAPVTRDLLDITRIGALQGIEWTGQALKIGAATSWSQIANADLPAAFAGLQSAARDVGSLQIQNAGTIGGNICNASPAADGAPPLLTLNASVELRSSNATRQVPLEEFITGVRKVALQPDEMITAILVPPLPGHVRGSFEKLGARRYLVISITMTAAIIGLDGEGRIDFARVAVGACSPVAQRLTTLEDNLIGTYPGDVAIAEGHLTPLSPIDDVRGSGAYRLDAVAEQIRRAILTAAHFEG